MLCQIEKCWRYADRYDRQLVVDTTNSAFSAQLSFFFQPIQGSVSFSLDSQLLDRLNQLDCEPACLGGRLDRYVAETVPGVNFYEQGSETPLTFDFHSDHDATLLVHHRYGGGVFSIQLLRRVVFSQTLRNHIVGCLDALPQTYSAIHLRNTDYQTDVVKVLQDAREKLRTDNLLICSDDPRVIETAVQLLGSSCNILSIPKFIPVDPGKTLHNLSSHSSRSNLRDSIIEALADLMALSGGNQMLFSNVQKGYPSGFSMLAAQLFQAPELWSALLGGYPARRSGERHYDYLADEMSRRRLRARFQTAQKDQFRFV